LTTLIAWFTPLALTLAALGLASEIVSHKSLKQLLPLNKLSKSLWTLSWEEKIGWLLFGFILVFQLYMSFSRVSFDGDDAFFVVHSLTAVQQDMLYRQVPYTGISREIDLRNALATFPIWLAMLAEKSRLHATIRSHSVLPLFLLPMTYLLYFQIGKSLCRKMKGALPMFMVLMAVLQMFGNVSIYTNETFLMTRTWQGKSFAANFIIPAVLWLFLLLSEQQESEKPAKDTVFWLLLATLLWTAGIASSLAVLLAAALSAVCGLYLTIYRRNWRIMLKCALACLPGAAYVLLYIVLIK
jgi:hypothetical protein